MDAERIRMSETARFSATQGASKTLRFLRHQSTERLYHCVLLVCTFHTPHVHNLGFLRRRAELIDRRLVHVWSQGSRQDRALFDKRKEAYVKARYSKHYRITKEQLDWLGVQIEELGRVVLAVCSERIAELAAGVKQTG